MRWKFLEYSGETAYDKNKKICQINFQIDRTIESPVYVYYKLENDTYYKCVNNCEVCSNLTICEKCYNNFDFLVWRNW